ncbi:hypothetical protein H6F43_08695 [Leptolyngbya sp. FACHB-36]|uniref:hypothetical protein n=1 Tax=Leptolyngbya sp. FACHB-36 TaxID=2692808 RepID=UPI001680AA69|nr:hypothetical protein [Leptolyngbya sp. FACHB-36]MBD2020263.1 hypothetical protein [Leptolyngbya sp. FACHB-36]
MATLKASKLALADVYRLLKFEERFDDRAFQDVLSLEFVTESEQQQLKQIQTNFRPYTNSV